MLSLSGRVSLLAGHNLRETSPAEAEMSSTKKLGTANDAFPVVNCVKVCLTNKIKLTNKHIAPLLQQSLTEYLPSCTHLLFTCSDVHYSLASLTLHETAPVKFTVTSFHQLLLERVVTPPTAH